MNDEKKNLKLNTIIIGISNLGSKAISFILAPLYSFFLTTEEYGMMDLINTTVTLIVPFICLELFEGTFRFASEKNNDDKKLLTNSLFIFVIIQLIIATGAFIICVLFKLSSIVPICIISAMLDSFVLMISWYERGKGKMKIFAFSGVLNSIILLTLNIILMVFLKLHFIGWIYSFILAKVIVSLYLIIMTKLWKFIDLKRIDRNYIRKLLRYCVPAVFGTSMWWVMNAADRYIISIFLGVSSNGIYAVANKLPAILSVFENVFYQSWQTSAINLKEDKDRDKIYSRLFTNYFIFLTIGVLFLLIILKPLNTRLFAKQYVDSWKIASILVICVMLHALTGNLGTIYTVFKNTNGAFVTSAFGAIVNTILNLIFIPKLGILAAAITTLVGYLAVLIIRLIDIRKFVKLKLNFKKIIIYSVFILAQLFLYYQTGITSYLVRIVIFVIILFVNRKMILSLIRK